MEQKKERNAGIDILRIVSMFMVVMIHINGAGGVLKDTKPLTINWLFSNFIEQIGIVAVTCFALISGFVNYQKRFKLKSLIALWVQAFFYSFGITFLFFLFQEGVSLTALIKSAIPVMMQEWWYFSSYFLLFFFMPALNMLIEKCSKRETLFFIGAFLVCTTLFGYVKDIFNVGRGYSTLWLAGMYAIGAFVKKYDFSLVFKKKPVKNYWNLILYFFFVFSGLACSVLLMFLFGKNGRYDYNFPINFLSAFFLFLFFSKARIKSNRFLSWVSSLSFAVYLISEHNLLKPYIMIDKYIFLTEYNFIIMTGGILLFAVLIYAACSLIEAVRQLLFKWLKVNKLFDWIQKKCDKIQEKYLKEEAVDVEE